MHIGRPLQRRHWRHVETHQNTVMTCHNICGFVRALSPLQFCTLSLPTLDFDVSTSICIFTDHEAVSTQSIACTDIDRDGSAAARRTRVLLGRSPQIRHMRLRIDCYREMTSTSRQAQGGHTAASSTRLIPSIASSNLRAHAHRSSARSRSTRARQHRERKQQVGHACAQA